MGVVLEDDAEVVGRYASSLMRVLARRLGGEGPASGVRRWSHYGGSLHTYAPASAGSWP